MTADENNPQPVGNPQAASSPQPAASSRWSGLTRHIPPGQFARYLVVGVWNTAFAYATFAFFTAILDKVVPQSYMLASVLSSLINISVSFLGYKWFVFKTKGNYLREWIRCVGVYGGNILFGLAVLPVMVYGLRHYTHLEHFSFKAKETVQESSK